MRIGDIVKRKTIDNLILNKQPFFVESGLEVIDGKTELFIHFNGFKFINLEGNKWKLIKHSENL